MDRDRYEVDDPDIKALLRALGEFLKGRMPPGWGFSLFLWTLGAGGATFYLSSVERDTAIAALREWIAKQEADSKRSVQ